MDKKYTYAVIGAGRQGTAAAFDMANRGSARQVILADINFEAAQNSAEKVNQLLGIQVAEPAFLDASDAHATMALLDKVDACLSAAPYKYNLAITEAAIRASTHLCDLGGNTDIARQQHTLDEHVRQAGISVIPNCGQVPGMGTSLMVYAMSLLDEVLDVYMWDGGIPQNPRPPFNYLLTFHIGGLTNEYAEPGIFIRDWKITEVEPMTELEIVEFPPPIGKLEAFVAGGGTDTMPWTYEGKVRTLQNLTLRHPGHFAQLRAFYDLGLWDQTPIEVDGVRVIPRNVFHTLFEPKVTCPQDKDLVIVRVKVTGEKDAREAEAIVQVIDKYDENTGFTAMERSTGWSAAIVAAMMAHGEIPHGSGGVEKMVPAKLFVDELIKRGINVEQEIRIKTREPNLPPYRL
jgi:lysine 6-dehydrogenase